MSNGGFGAESMGMPDILVVDDNDMVGDCLCEALSLSGYVVERACHADGGWDAFRQQGARAVITDNVMQGDVLSDLSGLGLAMQIKRTSPKTPVIMLSAIPPQDAARVCDVVLAKPVGVRSLLEALHGLGGRPVS